MYFREQIKLCKEKKGLGMMTHVYNPSCLGGLRFKASLGEK
jgi:hypothetical protein